MTPRFVFLFLACAGLGLAQEGWAQLQARVVRQGQELRVDVLRDGTVRLGPPGSSPTRSTLTPELRQLLEAAIGRAKPSEGSGSGERYTVDGQAVDGRRLRGVLGVIAESAERGVEPEATRIRGKLENDGRTLVTHEGTRYALTGVHSGWEQALELIPSAQVDVLVWPGTQEAVVTGIQVYATKDSVPLGAASYEVVDVIGLTSVPERTVQRLMGPRAIGGRVLLVRDARGRTGTLHDPGSARAPRDYELAARAELEREIAAEQDAPSTPGLVGSLGG